MSTKSDLIKEILQEELNFFLAVNNHGGKASCQESPEGFMIVRTMSHEVQNEDFLNSYLADLKQAKQEGRNPMTEKYALMDNLIPRTNYNTNIEAILEIETIFQEEMYHNFPHIFQTKNREAFRKYLSCELQTLSSSSLHFYYENIQKAQAQGENLALRRYNILMQSLGKPLL